MEPEKQPIPENRLKFSIPMVTLHGKCASKEDNSDKIEQQVANLGKNLVYCDVTVPYDNEYLNKQLIELEKKSARSWEQMLEKAQNAGAYKQEEIAKLKLLPFFRSADPNIIKQSCYGQYFQDAMNYITENQIVDRHPDDLYNYSIALMCIGDFFRSTSFLNLSKKLGLDITKDAIPYVFGLSYVYQKLYSKAIECFSLTVDHENPLISFYSRFLRGACYRRVGDFSSSVEDFSALKGRSTTYITKYDVLMQLSESLGKSGNKEACISYLSSLTQNGSYKSLKPYFFMKIKYAKYSDIVKEYKQLSCDEQQDRDFFLMNVYANIEQGLILQMMGVLKNNLDQRRMDHAVWYLLGYCAIKLMMFQFAETCFQNARVLNPNNIQYKTVYGIALEMNCHKMEASTYYIQPSTPQVIIDEFGSRLVEMNDTSSNIYEKLNGLDIIDIEELIESPAERQVNMLMSNTIELPTCYKAFTEQEEPFSQSKATITFFPHCMFK